MNSQLDVLMRSLGYRFVDSSLLTTALTHRSAGGRHNERMEYLGDAVLGFLIAHELYRRHPKATEGELSRMRAGLVKGKTLGQLAVKLDLGSYLKLGPGELKSGGTRRESILAGALESVLAAVYLDGGLDACRNLVNNLWQDLLDGCAPERVLKDPKTRLQEFLQARKLPLPVYSMVSVEGSEHAQSFKVACAVSGLVEPVIGDGNSRRGAEQHAAEQALARLEALPPKRKSESAGV